MKCLCGKSELLLFVTTFHSRRRIAYRKYCGVYRIIKLLTEKFCARARQSYITSRRFLRRLHLNFPSSL